MEQKDYLLREIEKIGLLLKMIFNKIAGKEENYALTVENQFEEAKGLLLSEIGFDIDTFLSIEKSEIEQYISEFNGIKGSNIELLADIFRVMGMKTDSSMTKEYLERALKLYELCNSLDKTFSFDRERKINEIRNAL
jgi:hypothetical protein